MHDGAELRRAAGFLQDLEKTLASPLTDTDPNSSLPLPARRNAQSNTRQETSSAPPLATPQHTNFADLPRCD